MYSSTDIATLLVSRGFRVWPIKKGTKNPAVKGFKAEDGEVSYRPEAFGDCDVAILTGPCKLGNLVCVDLDEGEWPEWLLRTPTLTSKNGRHRWYVDPSGRVRQKCPWIPGIDVKAGLGAYAIESKAGVLLFDDLSVPIADLPAGDWPLKRKPAKPKPKAQAPAPGGTTAGTAWDESSLRELLADQGEGDSTNKKAGALGAMLADYGWPEAAAQTYVESFLSGRHVGSAMSKFRSNREGTGPHWHGAQTLVGFGLRMLGDSEIELARPGQLRRNPTDRGMPWLIWNGVVWAPSPEESAQAFAHLAVPQLNGLETKERNKRRDEVLKDHRRYVVWPAKIDVEPLVLNCSNGVVDLETGRLLPHDPGLFCSRLAGTRYDDTILTDEVERLVLEWTDGDEETAEYLWLMAGYAATGLAKERHFAIIHGPPCSGKSCWVDLVSGALGEYARTVPVETWLRGTRENAVAESMSRVIGTRLILSHEVPAGARFNESLVKALSGGGDTLTAAGKWKTEREFTPNGKLWITGNTVPDGADAALRSRARVIPFTRQFPDDPTFKNKLEGLRGECLTRIVRAAGDYIRGGARLPPPPARIAGETAETMTSAFDAWLALHKRPNAQTPARKAWQAWEREAGGAHPKTETAFGRAMRDRANEFPKCRITAGGVDLNGYENLAVNE